VGGRRVDRTACVRNVRDVANWEFAEKDFGDWDHPEAARNARRTPR